MGIYSLHMGASTLEKRRISPFNRETRQALMYLISSDVARGGRNLYNPPPLFLHAADGQVIVSAWLVVSREAVIEAQEQEFLCAIIAIYPVEGREVGDASCRRFIVPEGYKRRPINIAGESGTMFADFRHELSQVRGFFISGKVFVFRSVERVEIRGIGQSPAGGACR